MSLWKEDRFFSILYKYFLLGCSDVRNILYNISLYKEKICDDYSHDNRGTYSTHKC